MDDGRKRIKVVGERKFLNDSNFFGNLLIISKCNLRDADEQFFYRFRRVPVGVGVEHGEIHGASSTRPFFVHVEKEFSKGCEAFCFCMHFRQANGTFFRSYDPHDASVSLCQK